MSETRRLTVKSVFGHILQSRKSNFTTYKKLGLVAKTIKNISRKQLPVALYAIKGVLVATSTASKL